MDVSKYQLDGEWIEIEVKSERELEPFRFKVRPILESDFLGPAGKSTEPITTLAASAVIEWNFVSGDNPIPCDEPNKQKYLSRFANYLVKTMNGQVPKRNINLVMAIVEFAMSPDSFLKS